MQVKTNKNKENIFYFGLDKD